MLFLAILVKLILYCVSKNVPPLLCYTFDIREHILIFFGRNITHKVSYQKTLYYATPNNVCFCTTWQNKETRKSHFFTQTLYQCIARIQPVTPWFLQSFWLILTLLYDSLNLVVNVFSSGCWGAWFKRKEVQTATAVGLCCMHNEHVYCARKQSNKPTNRQTENTTN